MDPCLSSPYYPPSSSCPFHFVQRIYLFTGYTYVLLAAHALIEVAVVERAFCAAGYDGYSPGLTPTLSPI